MPSRPCLFAKRSCAVAILFNAALAISTITQANGADLPTECGAYASAPLPAEAESVPIPKTFPGCASYRSYRGIGRPVNYREARSCAWQERLAQKDDLQQNPNVPLASFVGGPLILADLYFNGAGVKPDIPLAMRMACEAEEYMVTIALPYIEKRNHDSGVRAPLEFCDYAGSTMTMNFCEEYGSEIADDRQGRYYKLLKRSMSLEQQAAFGNLLTAEKVYVDTHASEVYQGGTIHVIRTMGSEAILKDLFRTEVVHFEGKKWPSLSASQIANADSVLDREYAAKLQQLTHRTKDETDDGVVTSDELASVEKAWEKYREAWVAFASVRYPAAVPAIRAEITLDRYRLVKTIR